MRLFVRLSGICLGVCLALTATAALAQSTRLYLAGYLGLNTFTESGFRESSTGVEGDFKFKNNFAYAGALGLRLSQHWRMEGEISYRATNIDRMNIDGAGVVAAGGDIHSTVYLLNGFRDFDISFRNLQPFLSAGVGFAFHSGEIDDTSGLVIDATDDSLGLAWQVGGGVRYKLGVGSTLTGSYRYMNLGDTEFDTYEFGLGDHEFRLGLEYDIPVTWFK